MFVGVTDGGAGVPSVQRRTRSNLRSRWSPESYSVTVSGKQTSNIGVAIDSTVAVLECAIERGD